MTEEAKPPVCEKHGCEKVWHKDKSRKAGGRWTCPTCHSERGKKHYKANKEKINQRSKDWYADNTSYHNSLMAQWYADNTEQAKAKDKAWAKANPEKCREKSARYRSNHPEQEAANQAKWALKNPDQCRASTQRQRSRKRKATVPGQAVTAEVIAERLALFDGCAYCNADEKLTVDHFIALNNGGLHVASNLVGACKTCNSSKKDKPVEEWFKAELFYSEQRWQELLEVTAMSQERQHIQKTIQKNKVLE